MEEKKNLEDYGFDEDEQKIIKFTWENLFSPFKSELVEMDSKMEALGERLPSAVGEVDSVEEFSSENELTIIDFTSEYCTPCYFFEGPLERLAQKENGVRVGKVDIDKNLDARKWAIEQEDGGALSLPLLISFKGGETVQEVTGAPRGQKAYDTVEFMARRLKVSDEDFKEKLAWAEKIAEAKGWKINPDEGVRDGLIAALVKNQEEHGAPYCPCKGEKIPKNVCPCQPVEGKYPGAEKKIEEEGKCCFCGLFCSEEYYKKYREREEEFESVEAD